MLVEGGAELEDQVGAGRGERDEAKFIQDDQLLAQGSVEKLGEAVFVLCLQEFVDQSGGIVEADTIALTTGSQGESGGNMGFAQARGID